MAASAMSDRAEKRLGEEFGGEPKSTENNLKYIARYITKRGNDWNGGKAYLRYKIGFNNDMGLNEDERAAFNWRRNEILRQKHMEEGITNILSLTPHEYRSWQLLSMGSWRSTMTGYLIRLASNKLTVMELNGKES